MRLSYASGCDILAIPSTPGFLCLRLQTSGSEIKIVPYILFVRQPTTGQRRKAPMWQLTDFSRHEFHSVLGYLPSPHLFPQV